MLYSGRDHQYIEKIAFTSSVQRLLRISKLGAYSPSLFLHANSNLWAFHTHWPLVWASTILETVLHYSCLSTTERPTRGCNQ